MSEEKTSVEEALEAATSEANVEQDELTALKERAKVLGITHSPNIGVEALRNKINAKLEAEPDTEPESSEPEEEPVVEAAPEEPISVSNPTPVEENPKGVATADPYAAHRASEVASIEAAEKIGVDKPYHRPAPTPAQKAMMQKKEALRLERVVVTCMNPQKATMFGEIFSVGNRNLGMVKKYVPFGVESGWHVPHIIVKMIRNKKYMAHGERKNPKTGRMEQYTRQVPEFSVMVLPPLTPEELHALKQRQLMAKGQDA